MPAIDFASYVDTGDKNGFTAMGVQGAFVICSTVVGGAFYKSEEL